MLKRKVTEHRGTVWAIALSSCAALLFALPSAAHERGAAGGIGLVERTGETLPGDIRCLDDAGRPVRLGDLLDRPVILSLVYYSCERICPQVLVALGKLAADLDLKPGTDYRIITFSFDPADTPAEAAAARRNITAPLPAGFPGDGWVFLTAGELEIARLTGAAGFTFKRDDHGFVHPVILVYVAPGGRISRYVRVAKFNYGVAYPVAFRGPEAAAALRAAARGAVTAGRGEPLLFCFPHEPEGRVVYFSLLGYLGTATLLVLAALFIYLSASRKKPRGKE